MGDSSNEDDIENEVVFLVKNFWKFLKMKNSGKSFGKGNSHPQKMTRRSSRRRMGKTSHQLKESCAMDVMGMDISRKNVQTIREERGKSLLPPLVIQKAQIPK